MRAAAGDWLLWLLGDPDTFEIVASLWIGAVVTAFYYVFRTHTR